MTIATIWYVLVGLYLFWLTLVGVVVTVFAFTTYRGLSRMLVQRPAPRAVPPKFNPADLPRRKRK